MFKTLAAASLILLGDGLANGQDVSDSPAFDVASIRRADPSSRAPIDFRLAPGGRLTITNLPLDVLIREAYTVKRYEFSSMPDWITSDRFDILAKAEGDPSRDQMMRMLRTLLEDRFHLKTHRERKEGTVYALVVARSGPKLTPPQNVGETFFRTTREGPSTAPGVSFVLYGRTVSVARLAGQLSEILERPVLDRTGIRTDFDFRLAYAAHAAAADSIPSLFTAIQEQLGLKLESQRGSVEIFVVDHAEKPSGN
jgi:uncharacterized protein (TIGR03435 family)